jgi:hypothetical protein
MPSNPIPALLPRGAGHQFLLYGDSCSGVPGALHERTFASVNAIVQRLRPQPEFILFPGDEIVGLAADPEELRAQWRYWLDVEMGWLDRKSMPMWHTTGNHTAYDRMSEEVFREVLQLPRNGPPGQERLAYWVRRGDLLIVFVHTLWSGLGGEGHVEVDWLERVLCEHADARHKLVLGHHPVFAVNGFAGTYQREIGHEYSDRFWNILGRAGVLAYVCSHILAFDVQVHGGVLQICTAGAGTAHRMPEGTEYLHCVQAAIDGEGFRLQVLDVEGVARERLEWPPKSPDPTRWRELSPGEHDPLFSGRMASEEPLEFRVAGKAAPQGWATAQTILSAFSPGSMASVWLGLRGPQQTLTAIVAGRPGRSPAYWIGPDLAGDRDFDLHVAFVPAMGPGGILHRQHADPRWTSFVAATSTGIEQLAWPSRWSIGHGERGLSDRPYAGPSLRVRASLGPASSSS